MSDAEGCTLCDLSDRVGLGFRHGGEYGESHPDDRSDKIAARGLGRAGYAHLSDAEDVADVVRLRCNGNRGIDIL